MSKHNSVEMMLHQKEIIYLLKLIDKDRRHGEFVRFVPTYHKLEAHLRKSVDKDYRINEGASAEQLRRVAEDPRYLGAS